MIIFNNYTGDIKMAFKKIESSLKLDIILALWGGQSYSQLSKKHNIPRATIYKWEQTAKDAIINVFDSKKPGKRMIDLQEENNILKDQLHQLYQDKHNLAQKSVSDSTPIICNNCGSSHIKKNGIVLTKKDGLKQRYSCCQCSLSIYFEVKKTLPLSE
jgi:transposase-like protein